MSSPRFRSAPLVRGFAKKVLSPLAVVAFAVVLPAFGTPGLFAQQPSAPAASTQPAANRANARQLLAISRQALAETAQAASAAKVDRGNPRYSPFWTSYDEMARSLDRIGDAMRARDPRLLQDLRMGTRALEALNTVWRWTGNDSVVSTSLQAVSVSYRLLRSQYGQEALRARHGGPLTGAERRQLEAWQRTQRRLAARLEALQIEAARQRHARMEEELRRLAERAQRIASAPVTLVTYLEASEVNDTVQGEWDGSAYYAEAEDGPLWEDTYEIVEELSAEERPQEEAPAEEEPALVILANLATGESWSFLEDETEIPAELGFSISNAEDAALDLMPAPIPAEEIPDGELWAAEGLAAGGHGEAGGPQGATEEDLETVDVVESDLVLRDATVSAEEIETVEAPVGGESGKPAAVAVSAGVRIPILGNILKL